MRKPELNLPAIGVFLDGEVEIEFGNFKLAPYSVVLQAPIDVMGLNSAPKEQFVPERLNAITEAFTHNDEDGVIKHFADSVRKSMGSGSYPWLIIHSESGDIVGMIHAVDIDKSDRRMTIDNVVVTQQYQCQGVATTAGKALMQWAFNAGITYIQTLIPADNDPARRWAESVGFHSRGIHPGYRWDDEEAKDIVFYGINLCEWDALDR